MSEAWREVDLYLAGKLLGEDPVLDATLEANKDGGLPAIDVSPVQGKLLHLLARAAGARRILEIGTLGGYSTIWLARAVPEDGRVVTLEIDPHHADVARHGHLVGSLRRRAAVLFASRRGQLVGCAFA